MLADYIPGEVVASGYSILAAAVVALGVSLARTRERVSRLEGRLNGYRDGDGPPTFPRG
jgi:hypothetical protein